MYNLSEEVSLSYLARSNTADEKNMLLILLNDASIYVLLVQVTQLATNQIAQMHVELTQQTLIYVCNAAWLS